MLEKTHTLVTKSERITMAIVNCHTCTNKFYVPVIGENEPSYCAYCGVKFNNYSKDNPDKLYNISGFPIG